MAWSQTLGNMPTNIPEGWRNTKSGLGRSWWKRKQWCVEMLEWVYLLDLQLGWDRIEYWTALTKVDFDGSSCGEGNGGGVALISPFSYPFSYLFNKLRMLKNIERAHHHYGILPLKKNRRAEQAPWGKSPSEVLYCWITSALRKSLSLLDGRWLSFWCEGQNSDSPCDLDCIHKIDTLFSLVSTWSAGRQLYEESRCNQTHAMQKRIWILVKQPMSWRYVL